MSFPNNNTIDNWLQEYGDPVTKNEVEKNLTIVEKINMLLVDRYLTPREFANKLGESPSEVSKWLNGSHRLSPEDIAKIEVALEADLSNIKKIINHG